MQTAWRILEGLGSFFGVLLVCDLLLTLHDIRNELRFNRQSREAEILPHKLF